MQKMKRLNEEEKPETVGGSSGSDENFVETGFGRLL
jgi:hypothetical protein